MTAGTSYNGWPANSNPSMIGIVPFEPIPGHKFPAGVKGGDVHTVFTYLVQQLDKRAEPIELYPSGDEWGYSYKYSANSPNLLSCHASGTAIDYNAVKHPNGRRGTWSATAIKAIREIQAECSGVIRWLGDATGTPDEMHFEIKGNAAAVKAAAAKIRAMSAQPQGEDMIIKIVWFKGEPTAPGDQADVGAAYLCPVGKSDGGHVTPWGYSRWIRDGSTLDRYRNTYGYRDLNTPATAFVAAQHTANVQFIDGPFKDV